MRSIKRVVAALTGLIVVCGATSAAEWPSKPIELVLTGAAGGSTDTVWRIISTSVSDALGQQIVPNYKPGAVGNIAGQYAARQPGDGYTFMLTTIGTHGIGPSMFKNLQYDPVEDFKGVARLVVLPNVLYANSNLPVNSVAELVEYAKANPKAVNYASSGIGASTHMSAIFFGQEAGIEMEHIPYPSSAAAVQGMLSGEADISFENLSAVMPHIQAGSVKALAVTTGKRWHDLADTPTIDEAGIQGFEVSSWFGVVAPKDTPDEIVERFSNALAGALDDPEVAARMHLIGAEPAYLTPAQMSEFIKEEVQRWQPIVEVSGAVVE